MRVRDETPYGEKLYGYSLTPKQILNQFNFKIFITQKTHMDVINKILGGETQSDNSQPESSELEKEMAEHDIGPEEVIADFANRSGDIWNNYTAELFKSQLNPRLRGQAYDEANELYREMQDEDFFVLPEVMRTRVEETIDEKRDPNLERYFESIDEWRESLEEFGRVVYRQTGDIKETVQMLNQIAAESRRPDQDYDSIPFEYKGDEFYQVLEANTGRINAARGLYHMESPSKEDIRENISEIPTESLEKFRAIFSEEGPVEVYEQSRIEDYN